MSIGDPIMVTCDWCGGTGQDECDAAEMCQQCSGRGWTWQFDQRDDTAWDEDQQAAREWARQHLVDGW